MTAAVPQDHRVYAVGDIHGCLDMLLDLEAKIRHDAAAAAEARKTVVYLGDYIDRGPASAAVVQHLLRPIEGFERVFLRGNHEDFLLRFIADDEEGVERGAAWMMNGGDATLRSYGVEAMPYTFDPFALRDLRRRLVEAMPPEHRAFYAETVLSHRIGGYFFAHAGVRPGVPLEAQDAQDLLWIRDPFLWSDDALGAVVIHGHSPAPQPEMRHNRINVDTGAVFNGRLTAVVLSGTQTAFLSAGHKGN